MKVLMISPGTSGSTSGAGVAVQKIGQVLASRLSLTVIEPSNVGSVEKSNPSEAFEQSKVVSDITRVNVVSRIDTFLYLDKVETEHTFHSVVKEELQTFSEGVVSQSADTSFDLIYAHDWVSFDAAMALKKSTNKPLVLHVHSLDVDRISSVNHSWIFDLEKKAFEEADLIIAVSNYTALRIHDFYDIPKHKLKTVYPGLQELPLDGETQKLLPTPVVLFAGRLCGQKGTQQYIHIAEHILKKEPTVQFIIAGDGELKNDLLELTAQKGIGAHFHFTGQVPREEMAKVYKQSSVFCMPSVSEPFGITALEAASAALPVVISSQCGASELLPEALIAEPKEAQAFANHILSILNDDEAAQKMVAKNLQAIQGLNWEGTGRELATLLTAVA